MKIIFMGTSEFACPALDTIASNKNFDVIAVYTKESKIADRGNKIKDSPIYNLALKHSLKIFTPKNLKDEKTQNEFLELNGDAVLVVSYGHILPKKILDGTRLGCFNIHPSLLPRWRGAAPIERAIMSGDKKTAVAIIKMDESLDSGEILLQQELEIDDEISYFELSEKLARTGSILAVEALLKVNTNNYILTKQDVENYEVLYAKKIEKSECEINWELSADEINHKIRALSGGLTAYFKYDGEKIKLHKAMVVNKNSEKQSAAVANQHLQRYELPTLNDSQASKNIKTSYLQQSQSGVILDNEFTIQCGQNQIKPLTLQREGRNAIFVEDFLRGFKITVGKKL
jgi:methionyl-tRNA formyltransferase